VGGGAEREVGGSLSPTFSLSGLPVGGLRLDMRLHVKTPSPTTENRGIYSLFAAGVLGNDGW